MKKIKKIILSVNKLKKTARMNLKSDVMNQFTGQSWVYSDIVKDHFFNPHNLLLKNPKKGDFDSEGEVGSPACGDVMKMWIKIDKKNDKIKNLKWKTFGCASAIAATSMFSVMVTEKGGMKIEKALKIKPQDIIKRLGGLPERKIHCSVLCDKAFRKALNNYFRQSGQIQRIIIESGRIIDKRLNITDKDIEEAVLEGARTVEDLQKKLKVGVGDKEAIPETEQLLRFYYEKYYGKEN
ncbi:MAG: Nitrogen-fixing NifU domain protein [Parcubacteria group bacterium GW2011_GWA2_39_18]|nr:MAG: Nitrogen-fixing NifU domain protein [Parcubacteria group bacterium GW2011_GWA2_39_18]